MDKDELIEQYKQLHKHTCYGHFSEKLFKDILPLVEEINPQSILDYGCGTSHLVNMLPIPNKYKYDPAIEKYSELPIVIIDLITCIDVLEHIPEEEIEFTLRIIKLISNKVIFDIGLKPATHFLPNGENAHCTIKPIEWWLTTIKDIFGTATFVKNIRGVKFLCKTW